MRTATWKATSGLELASVDEPLPAPGQSIVRIAACGICGTDIHLFNGSLKPVPGSTPGHEIAATVEASDSFSSGELVAIEPVIACRQCPSCRSGSPQRCKSLRLVGISSPGGMQQKLLVPDDNIYRVPSGVSAQEAALAEPLAVCLRGVNQADIPVGGRVLILGAGTIGLLTLTLVRGVASEVAIAARYPHQRALAERIGAVVFDSESKDVRAWSRDRQPDVVFETVGGEATTLSDAVMSARPGGTVVVLGVFTGRPGLPAYRLVNDEIRLIGSVMYGRSGLESEFGAAVALLPSVKDELASLITSVLPLERVNEAFAVAGEKRTGALKVLVLPNP